jgi:class 3 adenylate cyclase
MRVTQNIAYDYDASRNRMQDILDSTETFDEVAAIPNRDKLTYKNGFYIECYAIFIDIRDSSQLPGRYNRPTLAKIYRAFISEIVALFQSSTKCKEINIVGDSVWGVYEYQTNNDITEVFHAAYAANSLIQTMNYKMRQKNIAPIKVGIGIDRGRALMIQAGFNGSGINDVIYMGGVVNSASKHCSKANKEVQSPIVISPLVWSDLGNRLAANGNTYQSIFNHNFLGNYYYGDLVRVDMQNWLAVQP